MTVNTIANSTSFVGNGVSTTFPIDFQFYVKPDLVVTADDNVVPIGDYSISGGGGNTGSITFINPPLNAVQIKVTRLLPFVQQATFTRNDPFPAKAHEIALDRIVMMIQQVEGGSGGGGEISPEYIQDVVASMFGPGVGISFAYDDTAGTILATVTSPGLPDAPNDNIYYVRRNNNWIQMAWGDIAGVPTLFPPTAHSHPSSDIPDLTETVQDLIAPVFVHSGHTNINFTYDDTLGQIFAVSSAGTIESAEAEYDWDDTSTVMADPGVGKVRGNAATMNAITSFAISITDKNGNLPSVVALDVGDLLIFSNHTAPTPGKYTIAAVTPNTGWVKVDVAADSTYSTGNPGNGDDFVIGYVRAGGGGGGGLPEAPNDGTVYGRGSLGWAHVPYSDLVGIPASFPASPHNHVMADITDLAAALAAKAPLASPALTGTPTAPTAGAGNSSTQLATTAFVATGLATKSNTGHTHATSDVSGLDAALAAKAAKTQPDFMSWLFEAPTAKDYKLIQKCPVGFTINKIVAVSTAGTCTVQGKIDGVALGGSANSVTSAESEQTHATSNAVAVDADFSLTFSAITAVANVTVTVGITRTLS